MLLTNWNTPVTSDALFTLIEDADSTHIYHYFLSFVFECEDEAKVKDIENLLDHGTGFIYSKLSVKATVRNSAVEEVMDMDLGRQMEEEPPENFKEMADSNRKMLEEEIATDFEIQCGEGKIVKCHKGMLGGRIKVFERMFQHERMKEATEGKLEMEEMSEKGVRALLRWVYWKDEKEAFLDSDVAVELLIAGEKYDLEGLVTKMKEIILEKRGYDEEWFSVEGAVVLYGWAKNLENMKEVKEKAVNVLKFFKKMLPGKLDESEEYQAWIKNNAETAMEWN